MRAVFMVVAAFALLGGAGGQAPVSDPVVLFHPRAEGTHALFAASVAPDGSVGAPLEVARPLVAEPQVATNVRGDAVAVWIAARGGEEDEDGGPVFTAVRPAGAASFGPPERVTRRRAEFVAVAVNGRGDAIVALFATYDERNYTVWRPAGSSFAPPRRAPGDYPFGSLALFDSGVALLMASAGDSGGVYESTGGGPWTHRQTFNPGGDVFDLGATANGAGVTLAWWNDSERWRVMERGSDGTFRRVAALGTRPGELVAAAVGDRGDAVVVLQRRTSLYAAVRDPAGEWTSPSPIALDAHGSLAAGVGPDGTIAIGDRLHRGAITAALRTPGATTFAASELYQPTGLELEHYAPPAFAFGPGHATLAWEEADGDRVRGAARTLSADGPGSRQVFADLPQWVRERPASACSPRGTRTLARTRTARIYVRRHRRYADVVGCLFARGKPVGLMAFYPPPRHIAAGLGGPLAATESEICDTGCVPTVLVVDLRDEEGGIGAEYELENDAVGSVVVRPDRGVAWIECISGRYTCSKGVHGAAVYTAGLDDDLSYPDRIAHGRRIRPFSLRVRNGRLTWRDGKRLRSAPFPQQP